MGAPQQFLTGARSEPYPPTFFLLMGPVFLLPQVPAAVLWVGLQEAALALTLLVLYAALGRPSMVEGLLAIAAVLVFLPVRESLFEGQFGVVLALLSVLALFFLQRRQEVLGGVALGLAIALKLTPVLLFPYFLWKRGVRLLLAAAATFLAVAAATLAAGWAPRWPEYLAEVGPLGRGTAFIANQSINGVLLRLFQPDFSGQPIPPLPAWLTALWYALVLALALAVTLAVRRMPLPQPERTWTEYSIVLLALPLAQPFAWFHHHAAALVAVVVAIRLLRRGLLPFSAGAGLLLAYALVTVVAYPAHRAARSIAGVDLPQHPLLWVGTSLTVAAVGLAIGCLAFASSRVRESPIQ